MMREEQQILQENARLQQQMRAQEIEDIGRLAAAQAQGQAVVAEARERARAGGVHRSRIRGLPVTEPSNLPPHTFNLCEAAETAAARSGTAPRNMKMLLSSVKRPAPDGKLLDM